MKRDVTIITTLIVTLIILAFVILIISTNRADLFTSDDSRQYVSHFSRTLVIYGAVFSFGLVVVLIASGVHISLKHERNSTLFWPTLGITASVAFILMISAINAIDRLMHTTKLWNITNEPELVIANTIAFAILVVCLAWYQLVTLFGQVSAAYTVIIFGGLTVIATTVVLVATS